MDGLGVKVLGILPHLTELTHITVDFLARTLFAKVITGEKGLNNKIKNVFVGAMSAETAIRNPLFKKDNKLIITSGDRHDMIIAALETDTAGIVLTCNLLPEPKVIAKASERGIPMLLMPHDTFKVAKMIDDMEPLLAIADSKRIEAIERLIKENVDLGAIFG
jgi:BioD-like phosphotransacetylase family protein